MPKKLTAATAAWVVAVDMGYGHQRPAASLRHLAYRQEIITANTYPGIPREDSKIWKDSRKFYDFISRFKRYPVIGEPVYKLYDKLQEIPGKKSDNPGDR